MKIKDFKCKCGHDNFFFAYKGNQKGIYCSYCGKWFKWADKDEQNLSMKQASVLDKIKAEITHRHLSINEKSEFDNGRTYAYEEVIDIIDKYKAESEKFE